MIYPCRNKNSRKGTGLIGLTILLLFVGSTVATGQGETSAEYYSRKSNQASLIPAFAHFINPVSGEILYDGRLTEDKFWENIRFLVVSDIHISNSSSKMNKMESLVSGINEGKYEGVDFLVITGDCVSSFLENRNRDHGDPGNNRVLRLIDLLEPLQIPFYLAMGNHEYKIDRNKDSDASFTQAEIDTIEAMWKRYTGEEPYYSFREGGMKFVVLNTMRGRPQNRLFDDEQMKWFRKELSSPEPVVLFFHHPVRTGHLKIWARKKDMVRKKTEPEFMALCKEYQKNIFGIFVGHGHFWVKDKLYRKIPVFETASFGDKPDVIGYMVVVNATGKENTEIKKVVQKRDK